MCWRTLLSCLLAMPDAPGGPGHIVSEHPYQSTARSGLAVCLILEIPPIPLIFGRLQASVSIGLVVSQFALACGSGWRADTNPTRKRGAGNQTETLPSDFQA